MCNNNEQFFEYLMNWLAWLVRYGHKKPRVAIVMHGKEGIGKAGGPPFFHSVGFH